MRRTLDTLYRLSGYISACFLAAICFTVAAQVALNLIDKLASWITGAAIGLTIPSYSDFTGFFLAAASFLALAYTIREGGHIRVTLILQALSQRVRRIFEFWSAGLAAAISIYMTVYTARLVHDSYKFGDVSSGIIAVPIWIPQSTTAIGLAILSIALIDTLYGLLRGQPAPYEGKGENLLAQTELTPTDEQHTAKPGVE